MDFSYNVGKKTDVGGKFTKGFDRLGKGDLSLVDLNAVLLLEGFGNFLRGDRAIKTLVGTCRQHEADDDLLELFRRFFRGLLFNFDLVLLGGFFVFYFVERLIVRGNGELFGKQEVSCVSVRNFDDLIFFALSLDVGG